MTIKFDDDTISTTTTKGVDNMPFLQNKHSKLTILSMTQIAVCASILCVSAYIIIPLPIIPIPFTLQVLAVVLVALLLKPTHALIAQTLYTLLGIIGLPVFSGGKGGFGVLLSPTGGFIIGFVVASFLISLFKGKKENILRYILISVFIGIPAIYVFGIVFYMIYSSSGLIKAIAEMTSVFAVIDVSKCIIASLLAIALRKALAKANVFYV